MKNRTRRAILASCALVLALGAGSARADETTFCNAYITTLPYTITTQGHYCFNRNLSTAITTGNAITINVDFVVLDLNNFKLGGGAAGLGTEAVGVFSNNRNNITVRNGNIRGFKYAVRLIGTGGGHLVENNFLDGNTHYAVVLAGQSTLIRNNQIANTGGTTATGNFWTYGIYAEYTGTGQLSVARDNVITNTFNTNATYGATGIGAGVAERNVITLGTVAAGNKSGIWASVCRDNTVLGNDSGEAFNRCNILAGDNVTDTP